MESRMSAMEKAMEAEREVTRQVTRQVGEVADEWEKGLLAFQISSTLIRKGSPVVRLINSLSLFLLVLTNFGIDEKKQRMWRWVDYVNSSDR